MKAAPGKSQVRKPVRIALALTWDGARHSMRALPAGVRKFLRPSGVSAPSSAQVSRLLQNGELEEIRICWVPVLAGGDQVITLPFPTPRQMRINFRAVSLKQIGDILCAIYRRRR